MIRENLMMLIDRYAMRVEGPCTGYCISFIAMLLLPIFIVSVNEGKLFAQDVPQYRFQREIEIAELERDELVAVPLDAAVYSNTQNSLNDLRIVDSVGTAIPFIVRKKCGIESSLTEKTWRASDITLKPIEQTGLEIHFELNDDDLIPDGLRIVTPLTNFEQRVNVFAIDEAEQEMPLAEDEVIFDYSQFMDVRSVEVKLAGTDARKFRIRIDGLTSRQQSHLTELTRQLTGGEEVSQRLRTTLIDRPFRIDRIELWAEFEESRTKILDYFPHELTSVETSIEDKSNATIIDIESKSQPLTHVMIKTPAVNFQRGAVISELTTPQNRTNLVQIGSASLVHIDFRDILKEQLEIRFPENRHGRYRITIVNGDNLPLPIDDVLAAGSVDEVVFLANNNTDYVLQYGNPNLVQPDLDTAAIRTLIDNDIEPIAAILADEEIILAEVLDPPTTLKDALNNPYLIAFIVLIMIAVLTWLLYSAARRIDHQADDQTDFS